MRLLGEVIDAASNATDRDAFLAHATELFARELHAEHVLIQPADVAYPLQSGLRGISPQIARYCQEHIPSFALELPAFVATLGRGEVVSVAAEFSGAAYERLEMVRKAHRPLGVRADMQVLCFGAWLPAIYVVVGRERRHLFSSSETQDLRATRGAIALALAALERAPGETLQRTRQRLHRLTPKQRELAEWVARGYTNEQIALCIGRSPNTVRNNLAALYEFLGVASRAELVFTLYGG